MFRSVGSGNRNSKDGEVRFSSDVVISALIKHSTSICAKLRATAAEHNLQQHMTQTMFTAYCQIQKKKNATETVVNSVQISLLSSFLNPLALHLRFLRCVG